MARASVECPACGEPIRCELVVPAYAVTTSCGCASPLEIPRQLIAPALYAHQAAASAFRRGEVADDD